MRKAFITSLINEAKKNNKIFLLTGDLGYRYLEPFKDTFPDRFINVGVSEATMVSVASGLARLGYQPFIYSIATFVSLRAFEHIRNLIVLQKLNVKIIGTGGGLAYAAAGVTHHAQDDIAVMSLLPDMVIANPENPQQVSKLTKHLASYKSYAYMRLEKNPNFEYSLPSNITIGKAQIYKEGKNVAIITTGTKLAQAIELADYLKKYNITPTLVSFSFISPLDVDMLQHVVQKHSHIITIEEHQLSGGFGNVVKNTIFSFSKRAKMLILSLQNTYATVSGDYNTLLSHNGLDMLTIQKKIRTFISS